MRKGRDKSHEELVEEERKRIEKDLRRKGLWPPKRLLRKAVKRSNVVQFPRRK